MLAGRAAEVDAMGAVLARGRSALLAGEPGIGKTALAREVAAAHGRGVLEGGGLASLTWVPYLALKRALAAELPAGDQQAVVAFVAQRTGDRLLLLDDLHWADDATLALVPLLAERLAILATTRTGDPRCDEVLARCREAGLFVHRLAPLADPDARAVLRLRAPDLAEHDVEAVVRAAHGNPFLLEALAVDRDPPGGGPTALHLSLGARVQALPSPARHALALLALLGHPAPRAALGPGVELAIAAGLALPVDAGHQVDLRHALVGDAAVAALDADARARAHGELARAVDDPGEAARHHLAAGEVREAHESALRAAEVASLPAERARHLALAADSAPPERADELRLEAARELLEVRDLPAALSLARRVHGTDPDVLAERALVEGTAMTLLGDEAGRDRLREGERLVRGSGSGVEARLLCELARIHVWRWEGAPGLALAQRSLAIAREPADVLAAAAVRAAALYVLPSPDAVEAARGVVAQARAAGPDAGVVECDALMLLVATQHAHGDFGGALATARDGRLRARELGLLGAEVGLRFFHAGSLRLDGQLRAAIDELRALLQHPVALGEHAPRARIHLALALADSGELREATAVLAPVLENPGSADGAIQARQTEAELAWLAHRPHETRAITEGLRGDPAWEMIRDEAQALLGWACRDLGEVFAPEPTSPFLPAFEPFTVEQRALAALSAGAFAEAEASFLAAAEGFCRTDLRGRIRTLSGAGEAALAAGDRERAAVLLVAAEREAQEREYVALLGRIQRALRLTGARRTAAPRPRAAGVLTGRESEVLTLVRQGFTSPQIAVRLGVAPSTVDSQVRSAMRKLGASSRRQAAIMAAEP